MTTKADHRPKNQLPSADDVALREALMASLDQAIRLGTAEDGGPSRPPRFTTRGTPAARSWDDDWVARIEAVEQRLDRRICGAHTMAGVPCELESHHDNGRCRFHGGFSLTGGQRHNRNATIHGLYSRRLRVCDASCPLWATCPCAGPDIEALPAPQRPTCPYEQVEYDTALTDALDRVARNPERDGLDLHTAHHVAMIQVMTNRAALALRNAPLVQETTVSTSAYQMNSSKVSPYLDAFTRLSRERRQCIATLKAAKPEEPHLNDFIDHKGRTTVDTDLDPNHAHFLHTSAVDDGPTQARRYLRQAMLHAAAGHDVAAMDAINDAVYLEPGKLDVWVERVSAAYRPTGAVLPQTEFNKIVRHILLAEKLDPPVEESPLTTYFKSKCEEYAAYIAPGDPG